MFSKIKKDKSNFMLERKLVLDYPYGLSKAHEYPIQICDSEEGQTSINPTSSTKGKRNDLPFNSAFLIDLIIA